MRRLPSLSRSPLPSPFPLLTKSSRPRTPVLFHHGWPNSANTYKSSFQQLKQVRLSNFLYAKVSFRRRLNRHFHGSWDGNGFTSTPSIPISGFLPFSYDDPTMNYHFSTKNPSGSSQPSVSFILDDGQDSVRFHLLPLFNDLSAECPCQHHRSVPLSTVHYHRY